MGYFFFILFIVFFSLISFFISKIAWQPLFFYLKSYQKATFKGTRIGLISLELNSVNYSSSIIIFVNENGLLFKPIFLFRPGHLAIFIPWKEIVIIKSPVKGIIKLGVGKNNQFLISIKEKVYLKMKNKLGKGIPPQKPTD